jgi:predicted secreted Zn-dependent protease
VSLRDGNSSSQAPAPAPAATNPAPAVSTTARLRVISHRFGLDDLTVVDLKDEFALVCAAEPAVHVVFQWPVGHAQLLTDPVGKHWAGVPGEEQVHAIGAFAFSICGPPLHGLKVEMLFLNDPSCHIAPPERRCDWRKEILGVCRLQVDIQRCSQQGALFTAEYQYIWSLSRHVSSMKGDGINP